MYTKPKSAWENLMQSFDIRPASNLPAISHPAPSTLPSVANMGNSDSAALLALCMSTLQQQGFTISGTTQNTRYVSSGSSQMVEQTSTQFSVGPAGSYFEQTRQSFFIESSSSNPNDFISRLFNPSSKE